MAARRDAQAESAARTGPQERGARPALPETGAEAAGCQLCAVHSLERTVSEMNAFSLRGYYQMAAV